MLFKIIAAGSGHGMELMVFKVGEFTTRCLQRASELVFRPVHLVDLHNRSQTSLIKHFVVCNKCKSFNHRGYSRPHLWKHLRIIGILVTEAMHTLAEPTVVVRFRLNKAVESICHHSVTHHNDTHAAYAGTVAVGGLKVYSSKVLHIIALLLKKHSNLLLADIPPNSV